MQLFLFLNGLAGRSPFIDQIARWYYIGAVPLLATLFLAQLLLFPRADDAPPRSRVAFTVAFSLLLMAFLALGFEFFAQSLGLGTISPRPFVTRRINLIVVEPLDNSFPCVEVALAAIFAVGMALSNRKWGIAGGVMAAALGVTRIYCGNNYFADIMVGLLLGTSVAYICGALFAANLRVFVPKPALQGIVGTATLLLTCLGTYFSLASTPRFASKLPVFWNSPATAATPDVEPATLSTRAARGAIQEGEGVTESSAEEPTAEELSLNKRSQLFLPDVEKYLRGKLTPLARPFRLLDVEAAPVKAGDTSYRCAALRFELAGNIPNVRLETLNCAARLVKTAFALDSQLQNVDITAIVRGQGSQIDGSLMKFAGDEVPVFTASIQRKNLLVVTPRWANDPNLDAGSWLRTRSRLYINEKFLPVVVANPGAPIPTPPMEAAKMTVSGPKAATPSPSPVLTPKIPNPSPTPKAVYPQLTNQTLRPGIG